MGRIDDFKRSVEQKTKQSFTIQKIDNSIEELIITGMIVDTAFYRETQRATNSMYFESDQAKILADWIHDYAKRNNNESPQDQIKEIFDLNTNELSKDEAKTMRLFLNKIINAYTGKEFNTKYVAQKAFPYLEEKAYSYRVKQIQLELRKGDLKKAKELFESANDDVFRETNQVKSMSDLTILDDWWWDRKEPAMRFVGALGDYMPPIYLGKLYAMMGRSKIGKSWWLDEWCVNGVQSNLNTILFSLEMASHECHERWIARISGKEVMDKKIKTYRVPVVDCEHNQTGECEMRHCTSPDSVVKDGELRNEFGNNPEHIPCTYCRDRDPDLFEATTWFVKEKHEKLTYKEAQRVQTDFDAQYGKDTFRYKTFPISSASVNDIIETLDDLERRESFVPDLVVIDYADIMKKDSSNRDLRFQLRDIWEELSRLAKVYPLHLIPSGSWRHHAPVHGVSIVHAVSYLLIISQISRRSPNDQGYRSVIESHPNIR